MNAVLAVLMFFSLPGARLAPPPRAPELHASAPKARKGGRWYFAESGHAVYCYGPVMVVTQPDGGLLHVATFCQGEKTIVPLKD